MTGFGKGEQTSSLGKITVEIKSLNHKNLSITCTPFDGIFFLEEKVKKILEKHLYRGKIFIKIASEKKAPPGSFQKININEKMAKEYLKKIMKLQKTLNVKGAVTINDIIQLPGIIENDNEQNSGNTWSCVEKALNKAVKSLLKYRLSEGKALAADLLMRGREIEKNLKLIKHYEKNSIIEYRKKIKLSFKSLPHNEEAIKNKLEEEVAIFARNCDIAEEITRLSGHLAEFRKTARNAESYAGKKLDFIAQEMQREINTIGAKAASFDISKAVIEVKSEIEKMREQLRNIE
jgi:uncharacterized protein (TIGR00255 family)